MAQGRYRYFLLIATGITAAMTIRVFADDPAAKAVVDRWEQTLRNADRLAVRFRSERINHVLQSKKERLGVFYRNEQDMTALRFDECLDRPLSAVKDINPKFKRVSNSYDDSFHLQWSESSLRIGSGKYDETTSIQPASAKYPDNFGNHSHWFFNREIRARQWQIHFSLPEVFPIVFCESPEIGWHDAKLLTNPKSSDVCLRLSLQPECPIDRTRTLDALFRPDEDLPYAVRRFDSDGITEFRFFMESIQFGENAVIPDDAFPLTTSN